MVQGGAESSWLMASPGSEVNSAQGSVCKGCSIIPGCGSRWRKQCRLGVLLGRTQWALATEEGWMPQLSTWGSEGMVDVLLSQEHGTK